MNRVARRKAQGAQKKVRAAEEELVAANETLRRAIPRRDVGAIAAAAERTSCAEEQVHAAAHELEALGELLRDESAPAPNGAASGEGVRSLLPYLSRR